MAEPNSNKRKSDEDSTSFSRQQLRYTEPDLRVIVEYEDDEEAVEKVYHLYAQNLARLSSFVDASLSVDMREKQTMEIRFHGIPPATFEKALEFLEDPLAIRSMTPTDALELVPFYDQYQFGGGMVLCDQILSDYIGQQAELTTKKPPQDLNLLVQASALAHKYNLPKSRPCSITYLNSRFQANAPFGATMFSEDHVKFLLPLFQEGLLFVPGFSADDMSSPLFPKYFVKCQACDFATKLSPYITLQGTGTHDGKFRREGERFIAPFRQEIVRLRNGVSMDAFVTIQKNEWCGKDWAILCTRVEGDQTTHVLWKCPYSQNLTLPPTEPWIPVDTMAVTRKPKIKYP